MSFAVILPFLRPVQHLIEDPAISEVMLNADGARVFVERAGRLEYVPDVHLDPRSLRAAAKHIARACDDEISEEDPLLDATLPDGSRVAIAFRPVAVTGTTVTIRKFGTRRFTLADLVELGMLPAAVADRVLATVHARDNILVSGAASTGKTTLLNALVRELPPDDRLIIIEDTAEILIDTDSGNAASAAPCPRNVVRFEARRQQDRGTHQVRAVTIRDCVTASLRHRPDRIIVGEVRGAEAADVLQALNTGHRGSISTIHASSARLGVQRLASCALQAGEHPTHEAICAQIADCVHMLIHLEREHGVRRVREVVRLRGYDFHNATWLFESVYDASEGVLC